MFLFFTGYTVVDTKEKPCKFAIAEIFSFKIDICCLGFSKQASAVTSFKCCCLIYFLLYLCHNTIKT